MTTACLTDTTYQFVTYLIDPDCKAENPNAIAHAAIDHFWGGKYTLAEKPTAMDKPSPYAVQYAGKMHGNIMVYDILARTLTEPAATYIASVIFRNSRPRAGKVNIEAIVFFRDLARPLA